MESNTSRTPTLTKKDVAREVAAATGEPLYKCEPWVQATIEAIRDMMASADPEVRIELRDFGVFEVKKTKAHFKPGKRLRETLQEPLEELGYAIPEGSADHPEYRAKAA